MVKAINIKALKSLKENIIYNEKKIRISSVKLITSFVTYFSIEVSK